jgi:hypothetical protein
MSAAPVIAALLLAVLAAPAGATWRPPVAGGLTRPFAVTTSPFAAGQHRGIDLRAAPGTPVRAPCGGRVVFAGRAGTSGGVVTLRCGRWRVTHLPLATITVHAGTSVGPGTRLGTVARGTDHAGLHLGVRREGNRFAYVDPLRFLAPAPTAPLPPLGRPPRAHRSLPPSPGAPLATAATAPVAAAATAPVAHRAPLAPPQVDAAAGSGRRGLAPWPAWLGLALVLAGAGVRWRGRIGTRTRRRVRASVRLNE